MTDDVLKYLFTLPPEEILKWFRGKGLTTSWSWRDLWQSAHNRAFTVAKGMDLDVLQSIKDEVDKIFSEGITFEQFRRDLEPTLKRLGWWGKVKASDVPGFDPNSGVDPNKMVLLGSPSRLRTIFSTNSNVAYNGARYNAMLENAAERPYWLYIQIERPHKRKAHAVYANKVFMWNDPIWNSIFPPNGWNCGCYVIALNKAEVEARRLKVWNGDDVAIDVEEGWDYNPGKEMFKPDSKDYDKTLFNAYKTAVKQQ